MSAGYCSHDNVAEVESVGSTGVEMGVQCQDCGRTLRQGSARRGGNAEYAVLGINWYSDVRGKRWAS